MRSEVDIVERVEGGDAFYFIAEEHYPQDDLFVGQTDVDRVAFDTEVAAVKFDLVARIERFGQSAQKGVARYAHPFVDFDDVRVEILGVAHTE